MKRLFEVCAGNMASVEAAVQAGATRIELCADLQLDGLTPPLDMLKQVKARYHDLKVHVLIRPREGDFVYSQSEVADMERDIMTVLPWADGIVCGALTADADIDIPAMQKLVGAALGKPFTFHRAFDVCRNLTDALEKIIGLGCDRVLTSGGQPTVEQGIDMLRRLNDFAYGRIIVMPGGGVNSLNARRILDLTNCREIHGSASLGTGITQEAEVRAIIESLK